MSEKYDAEECESIAASLELLASEVRRYPVSRCEIERSADEWQPFSGESGGKHSWSIRLTYRKPGVWEQRQLERHENQSD